MIVCGNCGHQNDASDAFCGNCGQFLEWSAKPPEGAPDVPASPTSTGRVVVIDNGPEPEPEPPAPEPEPEPEPAPAPAATNGDAAAARIVALDMALSGTPRDETDRYLAEHYDLPDREALLDEVYAAAGG